MSTPGVYHHTYLKQDKKCAACGAEIAPGEYWAVNTPQGVKVIHDVCFKSLKINGCHAQVEILYKPDR